MNEIVEEKLYKTWVFRQTLCRSGMPRLVPGYPNLQLVCKMSIFVNKVCESRLNVGRMWEDKQTLCGHGVSSGRHILVYMSYATSVVSRLRVARVAISAISL